jgi:hypothetical protein
MLLDVNPQALHDQTCDGHTLLSLATTTATKSHPNYALIDELNRQLASVSNRAPLEDAKLTLTPLRMQKPNTFNTPPTSEASGSDGSLRSHFYLEDSYVSPPSSRKRKAVAPEEAAVNLLPHFSRNGSPRLENVAHTNFAEV